MMKKTFQTIFLLLTLVGMAMVGCTDDLGITPLYRPSDVISFTATLGSPTMSGISRSTSGHLSIEEEEWRLEGVNVADSVKSRGSLTTSLSGRAGVIGIPGKSGVVNFSFDGDELTSPGNPVYWKDMNEASFDIYAYAPHDVTTVDATDKKISYQVADEVSNQQDVIVANRTVVYNADATKSDFNKTVHLTFNHILTAVRFKLAIDDADLQSITVSGVHNEGVYAMANGGSWLEQSGSKSYTITSTESGNELLMIPQTLPSGAKVTLKYKAGNTEKTLEADLVGEWKPGKLITYTLYEGSAPSYIYFDLAAGNVTINSDSYSGAVFYKDSKNKVATKVISGNHTGGYVATTVNGVETTKLLKFYVYQSTRIDGDLIATDDKGVGLVTLSGENVTAYSLPNYNPVTWDGKSWRDFITNNSNVESVIEAWDSEPGAGKGNATPNGTLTNEQKNKAVRKVGRTATKNRIHISGSGTLVCDLIIHDIYSSYQDYYEASRTTGAIAFLPKDNTGSKLILNIIGDNRVGCVHYCNSKDLTENNNELIFQGTGSLTVADTDFRTKTAPGDNEKDNVIGGTGYYSNHWSSAIGNNDGKDDCWGIIINSGVIFAGTTQAENCTAIGAGGNGYGNVTIKGGIVTAVAATTGTAIGGGIGFNSPGGIGRVVIEGGNVYAYNHANRWNVPSSAIGGAGSKKSSGSLGTVIITGGNVYAQTALGTAIGGGSSYSKGGGEAYVEITGGKVVAKSVSATGGNGGPNEDIGKPLPAGAGIGGGTGSSSEENNSGGKATIIISGNPIIRTGSVGGGKKGEQSSGTIGSAKVNITGGDIQAQFILSAGTANNVTNEFIMTGGTIRNSNTADTEYHHVKTEGGAVYLEDGTCTIGGTARISNCTANQGGAIYIKGKAKGDGTYTASFTMSGGTIEKCTATTDGGAVYLTGGDITLTGGTILNNLAQDGNGGGFYLMEGNFDMSNATIRNNSAIYRNHKQGNGGGVYITSSNTAKNDVGINIASGTINGNSSDRFGGGICIQMPEVKVNGQLLLADISVGGTDAGPSISGNNAVMKGGGLYVEGAGTFNATAGTGSFYGYNTQITIDNGTINGNSTTAYTPNEDVVNENGIVILNGGNVPSVNVTFDGNGGTTEGNAQYVQRIVTATNNILFVPEFKYTGNDLVEVKSWNTRADGQGDDKDENDVPYMEYARGRAINLSKDLKLYAIWGKK